jgi:ribosomal protein S18 acetylase RimI-like enzyme
MDFRHIADNLRQSFRVLADGRPRADVCELPGVSVASLGVSFQMFNAAFLNQAVETQAQLEARLLAARRHFESRKLQWALWICDDWLTPSIQRKLSRICETFGLRLSAEMPGMKAERIRPPLGALPELEFRRVETVESLDDFRAIGSTCFHVPIAWFGEVFDEGVMAQRKFACWVGYRNGAPVATAATVASADVTGIYNVATAPEHRRRGYGEAITRHAIDAAVREGDPGRLVLQSTSLGQRIYLRMGFEPIARVLVYSSIR